MEKFTAVAVKSAEGGVEAIFERVVDDVVSASVVFGLATEGFFIEREAIPRVGMVGVFGSDTPEIKGGLFSGFSI